MRSVTPARAATARAALQARPDDEKVGISADSVEIYDAIPF